MRKTILAAIALCPMLMHAQVNSPAQPQSAGQNSVLESRLATPKVPGVATGASVPAKTSLRVSSGVTFPKLVETTEIVEKAEWRWTPATAERLAVVNMIVDPTGKPTQLHLVQSLGAGIDDDVLAAVSRFRFQPGTLNHQAVPIEVNLKVTILSPLAHPGM